MTIPTDREEFKQFCLRQLGHPVIRINVDAEAVDDCVDFALKMFMDYHFDGSERIYYKYEIEAGNKPDRVYRITVRNGGTGYSNGDVLTFTGTSTKGAGAAGTVTTDGDGVIVSATMSDSGDAYVTAPTVGVTSSGTGANLVAELGGWVPLPDNIIGAVHLFTPGSMSGLGNMHSIQFQVMASELYNITTSGMSIIPYYMTMMNLAHIEQWLVGMKPIRHNRYKNRLYIDMDWNQVVTGHTLVAEAFRVVDPDEFPKIWADQWMQRYTTARIKLVWGTVLSKFGNMPLPGGVMMNGEKVYNEARDEIKDLEQRLIRDYSIPPLDQIA